MAAKGSLKVLMLTSSYPRNADDASSVFLRHLVESLNSQQIEVHVLAPADRASGTTMENGVAVTRFRYASPGWPNLAYGSGMLANLRRKPLLWLAVPVYVISLLASALLLIRRFRPDVVHAHWVLPQGLVALALKWLTGAPVITTVHGSDAFALRRLFLKHVKRYALSHVDAWTANTAATAEAAVGKPLARGAPRVIPMGVDVARFEGGDPRALRCATPEASLLLYVGRLVPNKGVSDLIRAYALLDAARRARTELWIVGGGECEGDLRALAAGLGIAAAVRFCGFVPNQKLPDYYAAADLLIAPSVVSDSGESEGQNVVLLEAAAAGLPAIATNVGGIGETVLHGQTGWVVPPGQPDVLAAAIERLLGDRAFSSRLAEGARRAVSERYDWSLVARCFHDLYLQVAGRTRARVADSTRSQRS